MSERLLFLGSAVRFKETIDNAVKGAKKVVDKVGNAVSGFFSGLGNAFQLGD